MSDSSQSPAASKSPSAPLTAGRRTLVMLAVVLGTAMQMLDATIVNVCLPHMRSSMSAAPDQITWVLTSYVVTAGICTPLTGFIVARYGRKRLCLFSVVCFTISSMLCGAAQSLEQIVLFRILQGGSGAFLTPMAQAVIMDIYPKERHQTALAIWSGSLMLSPLIGPTLGGYLSELYTWRWAFYINLPFGIFATVLMFLYLPESKRDPGLRFDFLGFGLLGVGIGAFQLMLDRGTTLDWFSAREIVVEGVLAALTLYLFVAHTLTAREPFLSPGSFKDPNFLLGLITLFIIMAVMFGNVAMVPTMLQSLLGYPVMTTGWLVFPRGLGALITMVMVSYLPRHIDARLPILGGLVITALSMVMMSGFTLDVSQRQIVMVGLFQGFGSGMVFTPLVTLAFSTMEARHRTDGTAMFSLVRNLGIAIGVSTNATMLARDTQINHAQLVDYITPFSRSLQFLSPTTVMEGIAGAMSLDNEINRQAGMIAYNNLFLLSAGLLMVAFVIVAVTLVYQKTPRAKPVEA